MQRKTLSPCALGPGAQLAMVCGTLRPESEASGFADGILYPISPKPIAIAPYRP